MKKMTYLLAFLALTTLTAHAQYFDWVKTYMGRDINNRRTNEIIGSVVDSAGNLYILGHFGPDASINGVHLLPFTPTTRSVLIAKMSPQGDLLWHKCINNTLNDDYAHDIRPVGDSAFMVMVSFDLPFHHYLTHDHLYYLDTLLTEDNGYLVPTDSIGYYAVNGFITFGFDGHVEEQHFVQVAPLDNDGNTFPNTQNDPRAATEILSNMLFDIDNEGNLVVCRYGSDRKHISCDTCPEGYIEYSVENGGVSGLRIIIDGTRSLYLYPRNQPYGWTPQIIVFSPHFDSILNHLYLFDSILGNDIVRPEIGLKSIDIDHRNNIYLTLNAAHLNADHSTPSRLSLGNSDSLYWDSAPENSSAGCVIKIDSTLHPLFIKQLTCTPDPTGFLKVYSMNGVTFDTSTNTFFVLGTVSRDPLYSTTEGVYITYNGDTLDLRNNLYWIRLGMDEGNFVSLGKVGSTVFTGIPTDGACNIVAKNNRVISQIRSIDYTIFHDEIIANTSMHEFGFMIWDYEGHEVQYISYHAGDLRCRFNMVQLIDSSLYLGGSTYCGGTFGSYTLSTSANSTALIAKYVDTSFMTPYVYTDPRVGQAIEWEQDLSFFLSDSPVVLTATATSGLPVSYVCSDTAVARVSGSTLHLLSDGVATITACQNGNEYGYYPAAPVTKTLTVSIDTTINDTTIVDTTIIDTTGILPVYGSHISVYPNPTTGRVTIDMDHLPSSRTPARDSSDIQVTLTDKSGAFVKYGNPFRQRVNVNCSGADPIVAATLTDMAGRREEVRLTPQGDGRYILDLTSRPQATYLLTLTTASGHRHTVRLLKQSDIFSW